MKKATVKWFNNEKGIGFANVIGEPKDIMIHFSKIESEGYRTLKAHQEIQIEYQHGEKGLTATKVIPQ